MFTIVIATFAPQPIHVFELFFRKLQEKISLTEEEKKIFTRLIIPKKLRKKQYLQQEGDPAKFTAFVSKGALRSYTIDERGNEHIIQFAVEGWYIGDLYAFITGELATYTIDAIEDSELLLISKQAQEEIMRLVPQYEKFLFLQIQGAYVALQRRLTAMISMSTEEKYTRLIQTYPDIVQRVPQHMIASYLGLTPETLSRTRKQISSRK